MTDDNMIRPSHISRTAKEFLDAVATQYSLTFSGALDHVLVAYNPKLWDRSTDIARKRQEVDQEAAELGKELDDE